MFAGIAKRYDLLNHTLSGGVDALWRRKTVRTGLEGWANVNNPPRVLDVCSGTGDLAFAFAGKGCSVVGADFCPEMLYLGERKRRKSAVGGRVRLVGADALRLPFPSHEFDLASVAFGIRNVADPVAGLTELVRVVRPGGRILILEFSRPKAPVVGPLYLWYFRRILPRIGRLLSGVRSEEHAYNYLPDSVMKFPDREDFVRLMQRAGLEECRYELLSLGIAALYVGRVARPRSSVRAEPSR